MKQCVERVAGEADEVLVGFLAAPLRRLGRPAEGPEEEATWFTQTIVRTQSIGWKYGVDQGNGVTRYTQMTNGGPIFAYVKDDKIIRITPIEVLGPGDDDKRRKPEFTVRMVASGTAPGIASWMA